MHPRLPIVLYTGAQDVDRVEAEESGIGWIVEKPFSIGEWSDLLRQILDKE